MEYAIITNSIVTDVIVADQSFIDQAYPGSPRIDNLNPKPGIGWSYDGATFTPPAPVVPPPAPAAVLFSPQAFRARYTAPEIVACDNYATFPGITDADKQKMLAITTSLLCASSIDLTSQTVVDAVNLEATIGLITAARAAEILDPASAPPAGAWRF